MSTETDSTTQPRKKLLPITITLIGLLSIVAVIAMPFLVGEPDGTKMPDWVRFLGHFHPVVLHLPIGIFILILMQELLAIFTRYKPQSGLFPIFFGAITAIFAVLFGFLLYQGGGFEGSELVEDHLWGGIAFTCMAILSLIVKSWVTAPGASQAFYRLMVFLSVGVMTYASHDGASITHGKDHLTKYAPDSLRQVLGLEPKANKEDIEAKPLEEQIVYADLVQPILNLRCVECHKEGKSKGRFRMDTYELLVKGGKEGEAIEPGNALDSNIIFRAELPEDDDEHMPPEGKTDIEAHELAVIKWWIDAGADPLKTVGELELTDEIRTAIGKLALGMEFRESHDLEPDTKAKSDLPSEGLLKEIAALADDFPGGLTFESQKSSNLTFTAVSMRKQMDDEKFTMLAPVLPRMVSMDLSATSITDASVAKLSAAKELRMIRLSETEISDLALETLAKLPSLESINLYGTRVTDAGVKKLASLPNLKRLYLWQTDVSESAISDLKQALPELEIVTGI